MIISHHEKSRKRKMKKLTKKLSILNAYINFSISKVSNFRAYINFSISKVSNFRIKQYMHTDIAFFFCYNHITIILHFRNNFNGFACFFTQNLGIYYNTLLAYLHFGKKQHFIKSTRIWNWQAVYCNATNKIHIKFLYYVLTFIRIFAIILIVLMYLYILSF